MGTSIQEASSILVDVNATARNTLSVVLPVAAGPVIAVSSVAAAILGVPLGLSVGYNAGRKLQAAVACGDFEGAVLHGLYATSGFTYGGLSGMLGASGIYSLQGQALPAAMTPAFAYTGFVMYGALFLYGAYGLSQVSDFYSQLKSRRENEGDQETLNWIASQVSLSEGEMGESHEKKAALLDKKWSQMALRMGAGCAAEVREELPTVIESNDPKQVGALLEKIDKACLKEQVKHVVFIILGILGIAASIGALVASGPVAPILFAISGLIWLAVDSSKVHNYVGDTIWNWTRPQKPQEDKAFAEFIASLSAAG